MTKLQIDFHASKFPECETTQLLESLNNKILPASCLYGSIAQATRWLKYHDIWSPWKNTGELLSVYDTVFQYIYQNLDEPTSGNFRWVSLGCGGGTKDHRFFSQRPAQKYIPKATWVDTSPSLVIETYNKVQIDNAYCLCADIKPFLSAETFKNKEESIPSIYAALGLVPNFETTSLLSWLHNLMTPSDLLLISANLHPSSDINSRQAIIQQYDNQEALNWYQGSLTELGIPKEAYQLKVSSKNTTNNNDIWRIHVNAEFQDIFEHQILNQKFVFNKNESIEVFFSNRFSADAFRTLLMENNLQPIIQSIDDTEQEGIWICKKA